MRIVNIGFVVSYGGSLEETAALVGLKNMRAPVAAIRYCGDKSFQARRYAEILNDWLKKSGLPEIDTETSCGEKPAGSCVRNLLFEWGWREEECTLAIRLAGLPLPPRP